MEQRNTRNDTKGGEAIQSGLIAVPLVNFALRREALLPRPATEERGEDRGEGQIICPARKAPPLPSPLLHFEEERESLWAWLCRSVPLSCASCISWFLKFRIEFHLPRTQSSKGSASRKSGITTCAPTPSRRWCFHSSNLPEPLLPSSLATATASPPTSTVFWIST